MSVINRMAFFFFIINLNTVLAKQICAPNDVLSPQNVIVAFTNGDSDDRLVTKQLLGNLPSATMGTPKRDILKGYDISAAMDSENGTIVFIKDEAFHDIAIHLDEKYKVKKQQLVADMFPELALGEADFISASTKMPSQDITIVVAQYNSSKVVYVQAYYGSNGHVSMEKTSATQTPFAPTSLHLLGENQANNSFLVFYDHFVTIQSYPKGFRGFFYMEGSRGLDSYDFSLANEWAGCAPQICFDGQLTAAARQGDSVLLIRSDHYWKFPSLGQNVETPKPQPMSNLVSVVHSIEAAFNYKGKPFFIEQYVIHVGINGNTVYLNNIIPLVNQRLVEAAVYIEKKLYLVIDKNLYIETEFNGQKSVGVGREVSGNFLTDFTTDIDAMFSYRNELLVFHGNYYYKVDRITRKYISGPFLIQGDLFKCSDKFYTDIQADKYLDIRTFNEFHDYRMKFKPNSTDNSESVRTRRPPLSTTSTTVNRSLTNRSTLAKKLFIVMGAILIAALGAASFLYYRNGETKVYRRYTSHKEDTVADLDKHVDTSGELSLSKEEQSTKAFSPTGEKTISRTVNQADQTVEDSKFKKIFAKK
ncbi:hypothetical protein HDE_06275 [Halotydeus destructor]|nr:hypothetical protein HDE_06275 [Halotydeus destructor]